MKKFLKIKILLICLCVIFLPVISNAEEKLILPQYTEEYQRWLELSDEEKANTIQPQAYEIISENVEETGASSNGEIQTFLENADTNQLSATVLPLQYIRNDYGNVKDQGNSESCWAYSAATVFDNNYYITNSKRKLFSNLHMDYMTARNFNSDGFNRAYNTGGNFGIALAYATNGMGIALESNMPNNVTASNIKKVKLNSKVSDYVVLSTRNEIKNHIQKYGVVSAVTYIGNYRYFSSSNLYNNNNLAYCCTRQEVENYNISANHAITLIGWDDNYTNSSFPNKKGAFIALNSYGPNFGNNGTYYIFYDDYFIGNTTLKNEVKTLLGVIKIDDIDYDNIYQHDPYGCTGTIGYINSSGNNISSYAANVFTRKNQNVIEKLKEISVYVPASGTITIYINANGSDPNINSATKTITTYITQPGYHTIELSSPIELKNNKFTVGVKYPNQIGIELPVEYEWCSTVTSNKGESYMSSNGIDFVDMKNIGYSHMNACIKAFTNKTTTYISNSNSNNNSTNNNNNFIDTRNLPSLPVYVFDAKYYAQQNQDIVKILGNDDKELLWHFINAGIKEGRKSSPTFCVAEYLKYNQDLINVFGRDYMAFYNHFVKYGAAEGRRGSDEFDVTFYKYYYPDLTYLNNLQLIEHYVKTGRNSGRIGGLEPYIADIVYDSNTYMACNQDLLVVFGNNPARFKQHWIQCGIAEGRISSLTFDVRAYKQYNKDLYSAIGYSNRAFFEHFIRYGVNEKRRPSFVFDISTYLNNNKDVKLTYGNNYKLIYLHYRNFGVNENRKTCNNFYIKTYMASSMDLKRIYGLDQKKYCIHYILYGRNEPRKAI